MYLYSIMPLDENHIDEICEDIKKQYDTGVSNCILFCMTLVPEGNPVIDKAKIYCEVFDKYKEKLDKEGVRCGILVQASIGHGYPLNKMFPFERYVGVEDGNQESVVCPYDEDFRVHFKSVMRTLASHNPHTIMVDDDFRLMYRPGKGCACPLHMKRINELLGYEITREDLYKCLIGKSENDKKVTEIFVQTQKEALLGAAKAMREGIDEVNPKIQGAHCAAGYGCEFAADIGKILAGEGNPVIERLSNGSYHPAEGAHYLSSVMTRAATQRVIMGKGVDVMLAETDTCPHNRYSTGAQYLHSHFTANILEGADGAKHWITRLPAYEPESGKAYRKILGKNSGFYQRLAELAKELKPFGCRIPLSDKPNYYFDLHPVWEADTHREFGWNACVLERMGIPFYYSNEQGGAVVMSGDTDGLFDDESIKEMLCSTAMLASDTALNLINRGFSEYIGVDVREWNKESLSGEVFDNGNTVRVQQKTKELVPLDSSVKAWSYVYHLKGGKEKIKLFPAVAEYKNKFGGTVYTFSGVPKAEFHYLTAFSFLSETRKQQLIDIIKENVYMPVYYVGDSEIMARCGNLPDGSIMCVLFNLSYDVSEEINLYCETEAKEVFFLDCDGSQKPVKFKQDGNNLEIEKALLPLNPVVLFIK